MTKRRLCPPPDVIARFASGAAVSPKHAEHIAHCSKCMALIELGRRGVTADVADEHFDQRAVQVDQMAAELLSLPSAERPSAVKGERYLSAALAQRFTDLALEEWDRDLNAALDHIHVATAIASRLTARLQRVGELEFESWKHRSTIHRERGEIDAARSALRMAERAIEHCADQELKRAIVMFAEANICACRDVWEPEQAFALLARCDAIFSTRDHARLQHTRSLRGIVHHRAGDYAIAYSLFADVAESTQPDRAFNADALRNMVNAMLRLGAIDEAEEVLAGVRATDVELQRTIHVVRDDALAAMAADLRGDHAAAATLFADARRRFTEAGEHESALLAGKDLAVALVADVRPAEARAVLNELLTDSVAAGSDRAKFTSEALAYLRDLAERERLTLDIAADVGTFIERIHNQRPVPFVPPMSLYAM